MARKQSAFDDLIAIAAKRPWWAGVALAAASYLILHLVAGIQMTVPKPRQGLASAVWVPFLKAIAVIGQVILPIAFLAGAAISAFGQVRENASAPPRSGSFDDYLEQSGTSGKPGDGNLPKGGDQGRGVYETWETAPPDDKPVSKPVPTRWSAELLNILEWKRFEEVCAGVFECLGFEARMQTHGADGGIDIRLYQGSSNLPVAIVQCKAWKQKVGVDRIRELRGVMAAEGVTEGIFATTGGYTEDAIAFARLNQIDLMDGKAVLESILKLPRDRQQSLLSLATAGDYTTPSCASCGVKMVLRTPKSGGKQFWGCTNYPECKTKLNLAGG